MNGEHASAVRGQVFWMLISAALFGYFGFAFNWAHRYTAPTPPGEPELLVMVAVLMWSLRIGAIGFLLSALLAMAGASIAMVLHAVIGLATAAAFLAVATWDWTTPQYFSGIPPFLLLIFAVWNGYSSWMQLREWSALSPLVADRERGLYHDR